MPQSRRRLIPRSVKLIPAAILSAIVLAILSVLNLLNFDVPSIDDAATVSEQNSEAPAADESEVALTAEINRETSPAEPTNAPSETTPQLESMGLVDVLIDGESYLAATSRFDTELVRQLMTLEEIVQVATEASGDRAGIKARVSRTFSATARAEKELIDALRNAGIQEDEIDQRRTLVSGP